MLINEVQVDTHRLPSRRMEEFFKVLIVYSVGMYVVEELAAGTEHSREGWLGLLWSERIVAVLFTFEYFLRWFYSENRRRYPFSLMAMVDLLAFLPFFAGFFVTNDTLHLIRTLRIPSPSQVLPIQRGVSAARGGILPSARRIEGVGLRDSRAGAGKPSSHLRMRTHSPERQV